MFQSLYVSITSIIDCRIDNIHRRVSEFSLKIYLKFMSIFRKVPTIDEIQNIVTSHEQSKYSF